VALKTDAAGVGSGKLAWVLDVFRGRGFRVLAACSVAGFAGLSFPAALLIEFHRVVWSPRKRGEDFFMTGLTGFGAYIRGCSLLSSQEHAEAEQSQDRPP
jgi:hypothetical protein